jgi:hypothetical protein
MRWPALKLGGCFKSPVSSAEGFVLLVVGGDLGGVGAVALVGLVQQQAFQLSH